MVTSQDAQEVSAKNKEWDKSCFQRQLNTLIHSYINIATDVAKRKDLHSFAIIIGGIMENTIFFRTIRWDSLARRPRHEASTILKLIDEISDKGINFIFVRLSSFGYVYIAKLFLGSHIRRRLKDIVQFLQFEEARLVFSEVEAKEKIDYIKKTIQDVRELAGLLNKYTYLQLFTVSSSTIIAIFTIITKVATVDVWNRVKHSNVFLILFLIVWIPVAYLLSQLVGSLLLGFSLKRRLMLERKVYKKEKLIYRYMGFATRPKEFPFDIIFLTVSAIGIITLGIIEENYPRFPSIFILLMSFSVVLLLLALLGRLKSGQR